MPTSWFEKLPKALILGSVWMICLDIFSGYGHHRDRPPIPTYSFFGEGSRLLHWYHVLSQLSLPFITLIFNFWGYVYLWLSLFSWMLTLIMIPFSDLLSYRWDNSFSDFIVFVMVSQEMNERGIFIFCYAEHCRNCLKTPPSDEKPWWKLNQLFFKPGSLSSPDTLKTVFFRAQMLLEKKRKKKDSMIK